MKKPISLKRLLLFFIMPVLIAGSTFDMLGSAALLRRQAETAYDRSLAGVLRAINLSISTESGGLTLVQPYQLLNFFEFTAGGNVYYRVATEDGLAEIGNAALPMPAQPLPSDELQFLNGTYLDGEPVRVAILARELNPPLHRDHTMSQRVIIQVAESLETRSAYIRAILWQSFWHGVIVIVLTASLLVLVVVFALRPLQRLRRELHDRNPDDLRPIPLEGIPAEVRPLVEAANHHIKRGAEQARRQRQFLDDASHQLRTPLAVLRTQIAYAQRERDATEMRQALAAMQTGLERATRVTNQMLALARAHGAMLPEAALVRETFCLNTLLEESARLLASAARARHQDYGLDLPVQQVRVCGVRLLLQDAVINLLDNAIHYCHPGATITLGLHLDEQSLRIVVQDNGPGMSQADINKAGSRFRRGAAGKARSGAGLGLAIVQTIVELHQGVMRLSSRKMPCGLTVELVFSLRSPFFVSLTPS